MKHPLKILMVLHMPWDRNLGGPRVQLELADEFRLMGHQVEKFDYNDAFPSSRASRIEVLTRPRFAFKAKSFVQAHASQFDIIDAHQANLPFTKAELGFQGLLVSRSVGLNAFVEAFNQLEQQKWHPQKGNPIGHLIRTWRQEQEKPDYLRSYQTCDLINVPNVDEQIYLEETWHLGHKCVVFPFGLSQQRQEAFLKAVQPASVRLAQQKIAFIGYWSTRKGSRDWAEVVQRIRLELPNTKFLFLGTGVSPSQVLADLNLPDAKNIQVISDYDSYELPDLLASATVGAFPSYMEGFGFGILEKLACGIPTVAYDIPGPKEMLRFFDPSLMVSRGNVEEFAQRLIRLLQLEEVVYAKLAQYCIKVAQQFSWASIAKAHIEVYTQALEKLSYATQR